MAYNSFSKHKYKVVKLGSDGKEISSSTVEGSRAAFTEQQAIEEQGYAVSIFNMSRGIEEYRTGVNLD